jgi:hypothetical protein
MTLEAAFAEMQQFWPAGLPFAFGRGRAAARLSTEFGRPFPPDLVTYLDRVAPAEDVEFATVGNPLQLHGLARLGPQQPGYSFNPVTRTPLPAWNPAFFLLADEDADPIVLDLGQPAAGLRKLLHGTGSWPAQAAARHGQLGRRRPGGRYARTVFAVQRGPAPRVARV